MGLCSFPTGWGKKYHVGAEMSGSEMPGKTLEEMRVEQAKMLGGDNQLCEQDLELDLIFNLLVVGSGEYANIR